MADIHDMINATSETGDSLRVLDVLMGRIEDGGHPPDGLILAAGLRTIALAIREHAIRMDYVTRDERARASRG